MIPQQENYYDSGVFMTVIADFCQMTRFCPRKTAVQLFFIERKLPLYTVLRGTVESLVMS